MIRKKFKTAVTDSGGSAPRRRQAGVTNLIEILSVATGETPEAIEARFEGEGYGTSRATSARRWSSC